MKQNYANNTQECSQLFLQGAKSLSGSTTYKNFLLQKPNHWIIEGRYE